LIAHFFGTELPTPVDGAFELNSKVYFFVGELVALFLVSYICLYSANKVYEFWGRRRTSGRSFSEIGLPADLEGIRLAYKWVYGNEVR
jgi:hypothetical protein